MSVTRITDLLTKLWMLHLLVSCEAGRILMIPGPPIGHQMNFATVGGELVKRGHEVHVFIGEHHSIVNDFQFRNITVISYECEDPNAADKMEFIHEELVRMTIESSGNIRDFWGKLSHLIDAECVRALDNEIQMKALEELGFDLVFMDNWFVMKCMYLIPHRLGLPYVSLTDAPHPWTLGFIWPASFVPNVMTQLSERMSFLERLQNVGVLLGLYVIPLVPPTPIHVADKYRALYGDYGSEEELSRKSIMWLLTSDYLLNYPTPNFPNMIETPGLTTKPANPLFDDLKQFMDSSTNGVIIVSFGSLVGGLPRNIANKLIDAFRELEENIIWKFTNSHGMQLPSNVKIMNWLPQNDLLGHQNTKLFVTHCGNNEQHEALYHGVPMVGLAIGGDQPYNCRRIEYKGYGRCLMMTEFTTLQLLSDISIVMNNTIYREKIKKASKMFTKRKHSPGQIGADAIEHILQYGDDHIISHSRDMPMYEISMWDITIFLALFLLVISSCVVAVTWCICCRWFRKKHKKD